MEWWVVAGLKDGELIAERPDAAPNPAVEVRELLPDGTDLWRDALRRWCPDSGRLRRPKMRNAARRGVSRRRWVALQLGGLPGGRL